MAAAANSRGDAMSINGYIGTADAAFFCEVPVALHGDNPRARKCCQYSLGR